MSAKEKKSHQKKSRAGKKKVAPAKKKSHASKKTVAPAKKVALEKKSKKVCARICCTHTCMMLYAHMYDDVRTHV